MRNGRCRKHGGKSTGAGAALVWRPGLSAANLRRKEWLAVRHSLGLRHPGGRPSKLWARLTLGNRAGILAMADALIEVVPAGPIDKPVEEWSHSDLLSDGARVGLLRNREIAGWEPVDSNHPDEIKRNRLIADCGQALFKTLKDIQAEALRRAAADRGWDELLARLAQNQKKAKKTAD